MKLVKLKIILLSFKKLVPSTLQPVLRHEGKIFKVTQAMLKNLHRGVSTATMLQFPHLHSPIKCNIFNRQHFHWRVQLVATAPHKVARRQFYARLKSAVNQIFKCLQKVKSTCWKNRSSRHCRARFGGSDRALCFTLRPWPGSS
jgi:hypothetical protein